MIESSKRISYEWSKLSGGFRLCEVSITPRDGQLNHLFQPTFVQQRGRLVVLLSLSSGISPRNAETVLRTAIEELTAAEDAEATPTTVIRRVQAKVWNQYQNSYFARMVPEVIAVCVGEQFRLTAWRAGPNGVAATQQGRITLLSEDRRFGALHRLGADVGRRWKDEQLLCEVSDLTQIQPPVCTNQEICFECVDGQCLILMSRGAFPFPSSTKTTPCAKWWGKDMGWRHGMGATVLALTKDDAGDALRSALADLNEQACCLPAV